MFNVHEHFSPDYLQIYCVACKCRKLYVNDRKNCWHDPLVARDVLTFFRFICVYGGVNIL